MGSESEHQAWKVGAMHQYVIEPHITNEWWKNVCKEYQRKFSIFVTKRKRSYFYGCSLNINSSKMSLNFFFLLANKLLLNLVLVQKSWYKRYTLNYSKKKFLLYCHSFFRKENSLTSSIKSMF